MEGEIMNQRVGRSSIRLAQPVCVIAGASIVGKKEGEGPLGTLFDMVGEDDLFGCKTWEEAESNLQKDAVYMVMEKAGHENALVNFLHLLADKLLLLWKHAHHQHRIRILFPVEFDHLFVEKPFRHSRKPG